MSLLISTSMRANNNSFLIAKWLAQASVTSTNLKVLTAEIASIKNGNPRRGNAGRGFHVD
jgi:hypothetical protein